MSQCAKLVSLATAVPPHVLRQSDVAAAANQGFAERYGDFERMARVFKSSGIRQRHAVRPIDWYLTPVGWPERASAYLEGACNLFVEAAKRALDAAELDAAQVDTVVTISSTGIATPRLDARVAGRLGFRPDVERVPVFGLGCAGGVSGFSIASRLACSRPGSIVLLVAVEVCTLAFRLDELTKANIVATALFGDGAAAVVLHGAAAAGSGRRVRILETLAHIFPDSTWALGFDLEDDGFHSVISKDVPALLKSEIGRLVRTLADRRGLSRDQLSCFMLHPGGRKILAFAEEELGLARNDTQPSWDVLRDFGNQSSASVLFVLHEWLTKRQPAAGEHGILAAFGPGLTAEMLLLEWS